MKRMLLRPISRRFAGGPDEAPIREAIVAINVQRITWLSVIFIFVHLVHIVIFWPYVPEAVTTSELWQNGVIVVHSAMLVAIGVFLPAVVILSRKKGGASRTLLTLIGAVDLWYLLGGASLAIVDQLVTPSITPLMIAAMGAAMVFALHPAVVAINYAIVLTFFLIGIAWTQANPDLLLTNRVNSISATGLGFGLAVLQWRNQVRTIRQRRRIEEQQQELEAKNLELMLLATRDALTGLSNRAQFMRDANQEVARMRRSGENACLIIFDLDNFKLVNDTYGHPAGDVLLKGVARILTLTLREIDLRSRFGGEEFAVLLLGASLTTGFDVAERLRATIAAETFQFGEQSIRVTASFGVALLSVGGGDPLEECYRAADAALYRAKNDGRNCVRCARAWDEPTTPDREYSGMLPRSR